jgi:predicted ABC-type transport system involved in lysophospholipase L1 biosynthesis ATPase subunit
MSDTPNSTGALLVARDLHKQFPIEGKSLWVLRGVHLEVSAGEFLAVRGASGTGKSTLLHLLGGLDAASQGEIWFQGTNLRAMNGHALAHLRNRNIGFVFQAYHLLPELDALENVCLPARLARISAPEAEQRARQLLGRVGLADRLHHRPRQLSGGEQQRVAIARALVNQPALLLADEPTGNLDSHTGSEIIDLLCAIRAEHQTTLIIATHDTSVASRANRTVHLVDGEIAPT